MTIKEYEALTGTTVPEQDIPRVEAIIAKSERKLQALLGYSLSSQQDWTELGKVQCDGRTPYPSLPVNDEALENLMPADEQTGKIQLFPFSERDTHLRINPSEEVYRAKIVLPVNKSEFITIMDLDNVTPYLNKAGLVVALSKYEGWFSWLGWLPLYSTFGRKLMLAVDADYVDVCDIDKYSDLADLWADMVTYYADPNYSIMGNVRSESIDSHSYSRASTGTTPDAAAPQGQASAKAIIADYAGPFVQRKLVR